MAENTKTDELREKEVEAIIKYSVSNETRKGIIKKREFSFATQEGFEVSRHRFRRIEVGGIEVDATIVTDRDGTLKQLHLERSKIL